jgi:hypothetical protein
VLLFRLARKFGGSCRLGSGRGDNGEKWHGALLRILGRHEDKLNAGRMLGPKAGRPRRFDTFEMGTTKTRLEGYQVQDIGPGIETVLVLAAVTSGKTGPTPGG